MVTFRFVSSQVLTLLFLGMIFTGVDCSNEKNKKTHVPLDSLGLQAKPVNSSFTLLPSGFQFKKENEFAIDPYVAISDNVDEVKELLLDIKASDQSQRDSLNKAVVRHGSYDADPVKMYLRKMKSNDSVNQIVLTRIFKKFQWPSVKLFGETASDAAFLVLIHSDLSFQMRHIGLFEAAVKKKEANPLSYAILVDRILNRTGNKQMYGTHGFRETKSNKVILLPIENESEVDKRRADLGLPKLKVDKCDMLVFY